MYNIFKEMLFDDRVLHGLGTAALKYRLSGDLENAGRYWDLYHQIKNLKLKEKGSR